MPIKENLEKIKSSIPNGITLVGAVKYASEEQIKELIDAGLRDFGFNTYQQLKEAKKLVPSDARIHFIGHLQGNKAGKVVRENIFLIQSVDSYELAEKINKYAIELKTSQKILLQVKTDEKKRYGIEPEQLEAIYLKMKANLKNINIKGLMTIPPIEENPENSRGYFSLVKELLDKTREKFNIKLEYLSMGMSADYKVAIEEGANMVRIGRIIFKQQNF